TTDQVSAYIDGSDVHAGGDVSVFGGYEAPATLPGSGYTVDLAVTTFTVPVAVDSQLYSVAVGGAGGDEFAVGGSVDLNFVRDSVDARISNTGTGQEVHADGDVVVSAADTSTVGSGAGALAIDLKGGAV